MSSRTLGQQLLRRMFAILAVLLLGLTGIVLTDTPAQASGPAAIVGMPFSGKWAYNAHVEPPYVDSCPSGQTTCAGLSSHPSVHHLPGSGNWSTDLYASAVDSNDDNDPAVKLKVTGVNGTLSFSWGTASTSCGSARRVNIMVGSTNVGWIYVAHLSNAASTTSPPTNGMTLGTLSNLGCNPGQHVHIELQNSTSNACYVDKGNPGLSLAEDDSIGVLGSTDAGTRQSCASVPVSGGGSGGGVNTSLYLGTDTLNHGQALYRNQYIMSYDGRFVLILQDDGNLVLYGNGYVPMWSSGTGGSSVTQALMQDDGNFVLYGNGAVWATGASGSGTPSLKLQNDGNLVLYRTSGATWSSGTGGTPAINYDSTDQDRLDAEDDLLPQYYLRSANGLHFLLLQGDGNLILYGPGKHVTWSSGSGGNSTVIRALMQADGNFVLYKTGGAYWATNVTGSGSFHLLVQNDGNVVIYGPYGAIWSTGTSGTI